MAKQGALFETSGGKLLTFALAEQEYGIPILETREVVGLMPIESVPQTPPFVKGVINLRGKIIPVISLRSKFNKPEQEFCKETCIVVVDIHNTLTGMIADSLSGVLTVQVDAFEERPQMGHNVRTEFIVGMVKQGKRVIIVLDMEKILANEDLAFIKTTKEEI
ncbi:chemotaxis protein CheW [Deltaproteobacteria bacterium TL4]